MSRAAELAEQIRTYGTWQGPDDALDELVSLAETADATETRLDRLITDAMEAYEQAEKSDPAWAKLGSAMRSAILDRSQP